MTVPSPNIGKSARRNSQGEANQEAILQTRTGMTFSEESLLLLHSCPAPVNSAWIFLPGRASVTCRGYGGLPVINCKERSGSTRPASGQNRSPPKGKMSIDDASDCLRMQDIKFRVSRSNAISVRTGRWGSLGGSRSGWVLVYRGIGTATVDEAGIREQPDFSREPVSRGFLLEMF